VNLSEPMSLTDYELDHHAGKKGEVACHADLLLDGGHQKISGLGNGPINAFVHALEQVDLKNFTLTDYRSHAVRGGSDADSAAYVQLQSKEDQNLVWGCGVDPSIEMAGLKALVSAANLLAMSKC
jgi:2-isopropylmalate synthase